MFAHRTLCEDRTRVKQKRVLKPFCRVLGPVGDREFDYYLTRQQARNLHPLPAHQGFLLVLGRSLVRPCWENPNLCNQLVSKPDLPPSCLR